MRYTIQLYTSSGSFSDPEATDVTHCDSLADIRRQLKRWHDTVHRYDSGRCLAVVWKGTLKDITDVYPDLEFTIGPKGGFIKNTL